MVRLLVVCLLLTAGGCVEKTERTGKLRDIEFTVAEKQDIPEALKEMIAEQKEEGFKLSYAGKWSVSLLSVCC